ncbi:MAG: hypothetical protein J7L94_14835 [Caldisericaceae bacterium]|nr:hypothetical protein [Caldisericaceae bacterium]
MEIKKNKDTISLLLFVSGMTERSLKAIKIVREICERELSSFKLTILDIFQEGRTSEQVWPLVPILIGNLPQNLIIKIKEAVQKQGFFLPILRAQFIQVEEWRGKTNASGSKAKNKNS